MLLVGPLAIFWLVLHWLLPLLSYQRIMWAVGCIFIVAGSAVLLRSARGSFHGAMSQGSTKSRMQGGFYCAIGIVALTGSYFLFRQ